MELDFATIMFYALAVICVLPGLMILIVKDIVHVAFWLLASLSGVAGLYFMLDADFLGATQILVYIGGILVLILFGIMMTNKDPVMLREAERSKRSLASGLVIAALVFTCLMVVISGTEWDSGGGVSGAASGRKSVV